MDNHINVTLISKGQSIGVRIPIKAEIRKLIREFDRIFGNDSLRYKCQLRVVNRGLVLDERKWLVRYPVTTDGVIKIEEIS